MKSRNRSRNTIVRVKQGAEWIKDNLNSTRATARQLRGGSSGKIRYAVVGLGHIAQNAILPAFKNTKSNSELAALVSNDPVKLRELSRQYKVSQTASYKDFDDLLASGTIDAVFIAEPNTLHRDFTLRAARAGVHVLCEKPLAAEAQDCRAMIQACRKSGVKLMTAYRLHFEKANLEAIQILRSGKIGAPRYFSSTFSMQARSGNIRLKKAMGGGTLFDIGIYCINAARYLFGAEPTEVLAMTSKNGEKRFLEVEEMTGALLRFPGDQLATFICSFGAADSANYDVVGTRGTLQMKNAYEYEAPIEMKVIVEGKEQARSFSRRDQFGAEISYFSDCILKKREPEPSGLEGLNDVQIIEALYRSARTGRAVKIRNTEMPKRPSMRQEIRRKAIREPRKIHASAPTR
jgi:glucose-fructose oxidoreductase